MHGAPRPIDAGGKAVVDRIGSRHVHKAMIDGGGAKPRNRQSATRFIWWRLRPGCGTQAEHGGPGVSIRAGPSARNGLGHDALRAI